MLDKSIRAWQTGNKEFYKAHVAAIMRLLIISKIQRISCLFEGFILYGVGIYHGCPDIAVAKQFLNSAYIVIGLQEMGSEAVAKGMGRGVL